ncbi:MAG: FMN-binding glutamate synthase family protein, partial [Gammaproteobacteria bacterium]
VATQDHARQRALVVSDKAQRVYNFHRNTLRTLSEFIAAIGLKDTSELRLEHFEILRARATKVLTWLEPGELLGGTDNEFYARNWNVASADSFAPGRATQ